MKLLLFVLSSCFSLPVQTEAVDRHAYCESCIITAKEFEKELQKAPVERRRALVDDLLGTGEVCDGLQPHKRPAEAELASACKHLLDSHYEEFHAALLSHDPRRLDAALCYEESTACVGVERRSFRDSKIPFADDYVEALLRDHEESGTRRSADAFRFKGRVVKSKIVDICRRGNHCASSLM